jgi:hypothetical protein
MRLRFTERADKDYADIARPPHPARLPLKCIGTAGHPLPQGGEGWSCGGK